MRRATHSHIRYINSLSRTLQSSPSLSSSSSFFFHFYNKILWDFHFISNIYLYVSIKLSFFVFPTIYPSMYLSDGVFYPILSYLYLAWLRTSECVYEYEFIGFERVFFIVFPLFMASVFPSSLLSVFTHPEAEFSTSQWTHPPYSFFYFL